MGAVEDAMYRQDRYVKPGAHDFVCNTGSEQAVVKIEDPFI